MFERPRLMHLYKELKQHPNIHFQNNFFSQNEMNSPTMSYDMFEKCVVRLVRWLFGGKNLH
jgi:hypothetical protein